MGTESGTSESTENDLFGMNRMGIGQRKMLKESLRIQHYALNRKPSTVQQSQMGQDDYKEASEGCNAFGNINAEQDDTPPSDNTDQNTS